MAAGSLGGKRQGGSDARRLRAFVIALTGVLDGPATIFWNIDKSQ
jgi:hypothetical protein